LLITASTESAAFIEANVCRRFNKLHMGVLLMVKILVPLLAFASFGVTVAQTMRLPLQRVLLLVLLLSNVMALTFFFEVTSEGSWQKIGTSVSHFGIMNVQVVVVLLLAAVARVFVGESTLRRTPGKSL
jgi:GPI ethanolamine phosphate transferase 1